MNELKIFTLNRLEKHGWNFVKRYSSGKYTVNIADDGDKVWALDETVHRKNGPAIIYFAGDKEWLIDGLEHRENGPAIEYSNSDKEWYLEGEEYSEKEWIIEMRRRKLKKLGI